MKRIPVRSWTITLAALVAALATCLPGLCLAAEEPSPDRFELIRAHAQAWLADAGQEPPIISSARLHEMIAEDWAVQGASHQIVSVRKPDDYGCTGHIPHAINLYWVEIVTDENLARLDPDRTQILYCYYGHGSMITATILGLLGYRCSSLDLGMMDWNLEALVKPPWDGEADHEVETVPNEATAKYSPPVLPGDRADPKGLVLEMARKYLAGEGSPVIRPASVQEIVDGWDEKAADYQVVDVRSAEDYAAGHVPHAVSIPWAGIAEIENLTRLDPARTAIVCSEDGQLGQLAATVLNLLGYPAVNMLFGMMDWHLDCVEGSARWDGIADYPVLAGE